MFTPPRRLSRTGASIAPWGVGASWRRNVPRLVDVVRAPSRGSLGNAVGRTRGCLGLRVVAIAVLAAGVVCFSRHGAAEGRCANGGDAERRHRFMSGRLEEEVTK